MISHTQNFKGSFSGLLLLAALIGSGTPQAASAQAVEAVGARARGMGGAFVAVADDASAAWWNPAGLPGTLIFDGVVDVGAISSVPDQPIEETSSTGQDRTFGVAVALPVAAISFTRVHQWRLDPPPIASGAGSRQEGGHVPTARSLLTQHFGVSFAQSLGDAVVVGVTTRVVWGGVSSVANGSGSVSDVFERTGDAHRRTQTRGDIDAGVLVRASRVRMGLSARNLAAPEFTGDDGGTWTLDRRVRAGLALVSDGDRAGRHAWVVAADADLTRDDEVAGTWRGIGAGVEGWLPGRRVALRGGVSASTAGAARPTATGGLSLAAPGGLLVELSGAWGAEERRGWGLGAHVMF
jgi:hypothetical protein